MPATPLTHLRVPVPLPSPWFWALVVLYMLLGLVGHDPWKGDDAVGFGIAWTMAHGTWQDWLLPNIAGQAVAEEGPLAFWLAALFIQLFGTLLQQHDAARLASAVWTAITIISVHRAARTLDTESTGRLAVLALLACLGLLTHSHQTAAEPAFLAGWSLVLWALARNRDFGWKGALLLAAGLAICYLSRHIAPTRLVLLAIGLTWFAPGNRFAGWRDAMWKIGAFISAHLLFLAWALPAGDSAAFHDGYRAWNAQQTGFPDANAWRYYGKTLLWFAFPAWPVALWWVLKKRPRKLLDVHPVPLVQKLPLMAGAAALASLAWTAQASEAVLLPLLPPLALLIAPGLTFMRRGQAALIDWFGRITFTLVAALIWLGYCALATGWPPRIAANFARLEPGFEPTMHWSAFAIAFVVTCAWVLSIARSERTPLRGIVHWCYGTTLTWLLLMTLWLPWIDYGRSYRPVAASLRAALANPDGREPCIETRDLGLAERASFAYFAGIHMRDAKHGQNCRWLLVQGNRNDALGQLPGLRLTWEGNRPGDRSERFRLYQRVR